ncbi:hypothetical protein [Desertivirga arenae]|uniref:hypothetical protein n=1 Tax=Desertivirga arenae TaxID=2810309 RepID=UPI001A96D7D1|nr:hypothetical protein [Pedobacter sp. SYSU D00823]
MIQQKEIFKKIGSIVVEINEQYQYLSENPEQLNDLELELFSANADFLSEHVKILRRINKGGAPLPKSSQSSAIEPPKVLQPPPFPALVTNEFKPPVEPVEKKEAATEVKPLPTLFEPVDEQIPEPIEELPVEEAEAVTPPALVAEEITPAPATENKTPEIVLPEPAQVTAIVEEPVIKEVVIPEKVTTIDVAEAPTAPPTLNDLISAQKAQSIQTTQYSSQPVTDLKTAISLNDKLLFIKELFNGYSLAYSEAIEILNRFESFEIAETFLKTNYSAKNNWPAKQDTVEKFYGILQRRYSR